MIRSGIGRNVDIFGKPRVCGDDPTTATLLMAAHV